MKEEEEEIVTCNHCGEKYNQFRPWEHGWPLYGRIKLGIDCCALDYLWGRDWSKRGLDFNHPAMVSSGFQEINFEWGRYIKAKTEYHLCWHCTRTLMLHIGDFFKSDKFGIAPKDSGEISIQQPAARLTSPALEIVDSQACSTQTATQKD